MIPKKILLGAIGAMGAIYLLFTIAEKIFTSGFESGVADTTVTYKEKITAMEIKYSNDMSELKAANRALADKASQSVSKIDHEYILTLEQTNEQLQNTLNDISDGTIRLYDHGTTDPQTSNARTDSATSCPTGNNDTAPVGLSKETSRFLVGIASEADRNTEQLKACQSLVRTYLGVIEQYNQSLIVAPTGLQTTGNPD